MGFIILKVEDAFNNVADEHLARGGDETERDACHSRLFTQAAAGGR